MKRAFSILALSAALAGAAAAGEADGKWVADITHANRQTGVTVTMHVTFDLASDGGKLTGTATLGRVTLPIEDGRIDGNRLSFAITRKGPNGERKILWEATLDGGRLTGVRRVDGRRRGVEFTANRPG